MVKPVGSSSASISMPKHHVTTKMEDATKERASGLFESSKQSIISTQESRLKGATKPLMKKNEGILNKIAKILARIFSFLIPKANSKK